MDPLSARIAWGMFGYPNQAPTCMEWGPTLKQFSELARVACNSCRQKFDLVPSLIHYVSEMSLGTRLAKDALCNKIGLKAVPSQFSFQETLYRRMFVYIFPFISICVPVSDKVKKNWGTVFWQCFLKINFSQKYESNKLNIVHVISCRFYRECIHGSLTVLSPSCLEYFGITFLRYRFRNCLHRVKTFISLLARQAFSSFRLKPYLSLFVRYLKLYGNV